jgi:nucleosome binding factor SPN SPT16 subunit
MARLIFCDDINKVLKEVSKNDQQFSISDKRKLVDKVNLLPKEVHMEIFYFLYKKIVDNYTINGNGVFINLNSIDKDTLHNLKKMVQFYNKNEKKLKTSYLKRYHNTKEGILNETIKSNTSITSLINSSEDSKNDGNEINRSKDSKNDKSDESNSDSESEESDSDSESEESDDNESDELDSEGNGIDESESKGCINNKNNKNINDK